MKDPYGEYFALLFRMLNFKTSLLVYLSFSLSFASIAVAENLCVGGFQKSFSVSTQEAEIKHRIKVAKERLARQTKAAIPVSKGDLVYFEYVSGDADKTPILIFGGLYHELSNYENYKFQMAMQGYPLILVSRRTQPESLFANQAQKHDPSFLSSFDRPDLDTVAADHKAVIDHLGFKKVDLVTLSYGSSVGSRFAEKYPDSYNQITFIAPLIYAGDHRPEDFQQQMSLERFYRLNPFTSGFMISALREMIATKNSNVIADNMVSKSSTAARVPKKWMLAGLQSDIRTAEHGNFDLRDVDFTKLKRVKMYLAGRENPNLLKVQSDLIENLFTKGKGNLNVVLFEGAEHALTVTAPTHLAFLQDLMTRHDLEGNNLFHLNAAVPEFNLVHRK